MSSEFMAKINKGIDNYSLIDAFLSAGNKIIIVNIIYFILTLLYLTLLHKYNSPYHWIIICLSVICCIINIVDKKSKSWLKYLTIVFTTLLTITYIFPYKSTSEILLHAPMTTVTIIVNIILLAYIVGLMLSVIPSTTAAGSFIVSHLYL